MKQYEKPEVKIQMLSTKERLMVDAVDECYSRNTSGPVDPRPAVQTFGSIKCVYTDKTSV